MSGYIVNQSISIKAPQSKVWEALTNPEKTKKYFFNCGVFSNWRVGSEITFKGKMFLLFPFEMKGEIKKIEPGRLLQYTLKNGKTEDTSSGFSTVTDELSNADGETRVSIKDDVGDGENAEARYKRSEKGWKKILMGLKKTVESEQ